MSRVGKKPIAVPSGVEFSVKDNVVTVKGPKGTLTKEFINKAELELESIMKLEQKIELKRTISQGYVRDHSREL